MSESAASILRRARLRASMTQTELAVRANVAQSVVSAYESASREPSLEMLKKLVAAAGFDVKVVLSPAQPKSARRQLIDQHRPKLLRSLRKLGARDVRLFGSVARGDDGPESDIDLLVDIRPEVGLFALGRMRTEAERLLGANVDIVPADGLKPDVVDRILAEAIPL
jgi:predicted nucleotidyltransferase/DNA-binding XRE family transcriptional regulator